MKDEDFSHPILGNRVRVEQHGNELHLIFVTATQAYCDLLLCDIMEQLTNGELNLTLRGNPTKIEKL